MLLTDEKSFDLDAVSKGQYSGEPIGVHRQVMSKHTHTHTCIYIYIYIYYNAFPVMTEKNNYRCMHYINHTKHIHILKL